MRVKVEVTPTKKVKLLGSGKLIKSRSSRGNKASGKVVKKLLKLAVMASLGLGRIATVALVGRW